MKEKKCKVCSTSFIPKYKTTERNCSYKCAVNDENKKPNTKYNRINKVSKKRQKETVEYLKKRIQFLNRLENKICPVTGNSSTEVHHKYSGKDRSKYYLDESTWLAVSRKGHNWIHDNSKQARELGLLY